MCRRDKWSEYVRKKMSKLVKWIKQQKSYSWISTCNKCHAISHMKLVIIQTTHLKKYEIAARKQTVAGYRFHQSGLYFPCCHTVKHSCCLWEGLPGDMVWFIIPIVLGEGTTPISAPTGVPALGDACFWDGRSLSCCSTILAARSVRRSLCYLEFREVKYGSQQLWPINCTPLSPSYSVFLGASRFLHSVPTSRLSSPKEKSGCLALITARISLLNRM